MKSPTEIIQDQVEGERLLEATLRRMNARVLGLTLGALAATALFIATNVLVLRGGKDVGAHLGLLKYYFPFYSVTFLGSLLGAFYAFVAGFAVGNLISRLYNVVAGMKSGPAN